MSRFNIAGLLGAIGELPSVINRGLLGPLPVNPQLGLDPTQVQQAQDASLNDLAFGMLASPTRNPGLNLAHARNQARQNFSGRMVEILREQEFARMNQEREKRQQAESTYLSTLPESARGMAEVAGPQFAAQEQLKAAMAPPEQPWRIVSDEEKVQLGLDPSLMYKTNGVDIETLGGRPPAPAIGNLNLGGGAEGLPDYLKKRQESISTQLGAYEEQADKSLRAIRGFDAVLEQARKTELTGMLAPGVLGAGEFLRSIGIDLAPEALTDARVLDSMINQNHMEWVQGLGGARGMTESENKKLEKALLKIQDSPAARVEVVKTLRDAEKRKYETAKRGAKRKEDQLIDISKGGQGFSNFEDLPDLPETPQFQEGDTATNPKTGEKVVFRNGRWVKQ